MRLQMIRLVIGLKISCQIFNQWGAKLKPIAPCAREFSSASRKLRVIALNCNWFVALFAPAVIDRSNCYCISFSTFNWKALYTLPEEQTDVHALTETWKYLQNFVAKNYISYLLHVSKLGWLVLVEIWRKSFSLKFEFCGFEIAIKLMACLSS